MELNLVRNAGQFEEIFRAEKDMLKEIFATSQIEHIGSTAIKNSVCRDIVDIILDVEKLEEVMPNLNVLKEKGYFLRDGSNIPSRRYFVKKDNEKTIHLTIVKRNSEFWNNYINIRDYLNSHTDENSRYNLLKIQTYKECENMEDYRTAKNSYKLSLLSKIRRASVDIEKKTETKQDLLKLSKKYNVPIEDIMFIYLNISGINAPGKFPRMRTNIKQLTKDEVFYFGLANREESPFLLNGDDIIFENQPFAKLVNLENDDCASSYFRKNKTVITLNSNRRSTCRGCKFCPNNLELNSEDDNLNTEEKMLKHFHELLNDNNKKDLSFLERITVCTGCFNNEQNAVEHMLLVNKVAKGLNFDGTIHYIGSEIKSSDAMSTIKNNIEKFMYTFTVECFTNRYLILRGNKASLTLEAYKKLMLKAMEHGFVVNYIYILGLDDFEDIKKYMEELKYYVNYFPSINLFQPHVSDHNELISLDAMYKIEYYLKTRAFLEQLYSDAHFKPYSWECYRPLWYFTYNGKTNNETRI